MRSRTELVTTTFDLDSDEEDYSPDDDDSEEDWRPNKSANRNRHVPMATAATKLAAASAGQLDRMRPRQPRDGHLPPR